MSIRGLLLGNSFELFMVMSVIIIIDNNWYQKALRLSKTTIARLLFTKQLLFTYYYHSKQLLYRITAFFRYYSGAMLHEFKPWSYWRTTVSSDHISPLV
jgi:hypothetical protein